MTGAFIFTMVVLFGMVGIVLYILAKMVNKDSSTYDKEFLWDHENDK